jgi:2-phospho-L-lactate guanylyltransferase
VSHTAVLIPLRGLRGGKSRLATVLDPVQRSGVIAAMADHVIDVVVESNVTGSIVVVSREQDLFSLLKLQHPRLSLIVQSDDSVGLNEAVDAGREEALRRNAEQLLVLSADLPLLDTEDLEAMLASEHDVVIAPDRLGIGTNAIMLRGLSQILRFQFQFGLESRSLHQAEACRLGLDSSIVEAESFALDLDTPDDWDMLSSGMRQQLLSPREFVRPSSERVAGLDPAAILERA